MANLSLLVDILPETLKEFIKHYMIEFLVAFLIVLVGFFRKRIVDLTGSLVAVNVHGFWETTIQPDEDQLEHNNDSEECDTKSERVVVAKLATEQLLKTASLAGENDPNNTFKLTGQLAGPTGDVVAIEVNGLWNTVQVNGDHAKKTRKELPHETAHLHQFFNKVWGYTECKDDPSKSFSVRGQIIGEKLAMIYRSTEGFLCGAILLHVRNTKLMEGYEIGRDRATGEIYHKTYTWNRRRGRLA